MAFSAALVVASAVLGVLILLAVYFWLKISRTHYWKTKNVPSVSPLNFLSTFTGSFSGGKRKPFYEVDVEWCKKYGRVFGAYLGLSPMLLVADPEHLRNIFVKDFHVFQDRRSFETNNDIVNSFLTALSGENWKRVRSVVTPCFSTGKLKKPEPNYEALSEMKYMDAAINETLRMAPPSARTDRKTMQDYPLGDTGITIPKDMYVTIPIYGMHYDPEFFPEPEEYQPERFLPENKDQIQPYTFLPFGAGPRNCLGMRFALMEIKVCLFHVYRAVTFERCSETKVPIEVCHGNGLYQPKAVTLKVIKRNT